MKKNKRVSRRLARVTSRSIHFGAVVLMAFIVAIAYVLASSSQSRLIETIGQKEKTLVRLEDDRVRENARWEAMISSDKLEVSLVRNGIMMKFPRPDQVIRLTSAGRPLPGQLSVARAQGRMPATASVGTSARRVRRVR